MLTLRRKEGESIIPTINGPKVKILLNAAKNNHASISIDAPEEILILEKISHSYYEMSTPRLHDLFA